MTHARHERLTRYAAAASVVSLGSIATADIIHRVVDQSMTTVGSALFINVVSGNTFTGGPSDAPSPSSIAFDFGGNGGGMYHWSVAGGCGLFGTHPPINRRLHPEGVVIDDQPQIAQGFNGWDWIATEYPLSYGSSSSFWLNGAAEVNVPTYIGFGIDDPDDSVGILYGWAQIMFRESGGLHNRFTLDIIDYAYDDTGAAIATGQTESATAPVPGAGGLVALACGAAGLRRRRNRATTA